MINLCQYKGLSCFGCCGHTWGGKREVLNQIDKNTVMYQFSTLDEFKKRSCNRLSASGGCKSLIKKDCGMVCGLHPLQHDGKDYRDENCHKKYLCKAFKAFLEWDSDKQKKFLEFIDGKNLNNYTYSMGMDSDKLLKEFEAIEGK
jgi:hypothetical protein